ncbi:hypothetical protein HYV79_04905, partial [Candidatus Woesearchaeota archaeon]|nr:hypothetical protein [Candidatus Woesearchaeota archaeon]
YYNGGCYNSCDPSQQLKVPRPSSGRWIDCGLKECCVSLEKLKIPKTETVPKSVTEEFLDSKPLIPIEEVAVLDCPSKNHLVSREFTFKKEVKRETVTAFELTQERVELREDCNIKMSEVNEKLSNLCKTKKCSNTSEKKCSKNPKPLGSYVVFNENKKSPTYTGDLPSIEFTCDIVMLCECAEEKIST